MYRCKLMVCLFAVFLTACGGGGSGGDPVSADDVENSDPIDGSGQMPIDDGEQEPPQDDNNGGVIPDGDDDLGTIPDIGDELDPVNETEDDDEVVDNSPVTDPPEDPIDDEPGTTDPIDTNPPSTPIGGTTERVARWRAALAQEPSADASNREALLETIFEISRYDFIFEVADAVYDVEQLLVNGDANFEVLNLAISGFERTHLCADGGRVLSTDSSENGLRVSSYQFEVCVFGDQVFDGNFVINETLDLSDETVTTVISSLSFTIFDNPRIRVLNGGLVQIASTDLDNGSFRSSIAFLSYAEGLADSNTFSDTGTIENDISVFGVGYNVQTHVYVNPDFSNSNDVGFLVLNGFSLSPGEELPEWFIQDLSFQGLRGESPGTVALGQIQLDTDTRDDALLVLQADNGDPESFDLIGFTDDDTVGSAVYRWGGDLSIGTPRLYSQARAIQALEN